MKYLLLITSLFFGHSSYSQNDSIFSELLRMYFNDSTEYAFKRIDSLIKQESDNPYHYSCSAAFNMLAGDYMTALIDYNHIIVLKPESQYYARRGRILNKLGNTKDAITDLSAAIELDTTDASTYSTRGEIYMRNYRFAEAVIDFDKALLLNDSLKDALIGRGIMYAMEENHKNAVDCFTKAIAQDSANTDCLRFRAASYKQLKKYKEAMEDYKKLLQKDSLNQDAWLGIAFLKEETKEYEESLHAYSKVIEINPGYGVGWIGRGDVWIALGKKENACNDYREAKKLDIGSADDRIEKNCK